MDKKTKKRMIIPQQERLLDTDEFYALTDLLFETFKENNSACARSLGISRNTWKRWNTAPPTWPWWNLILRLVIKETLAGMTTKRGISRKHRNKILDAMSRIPDSSDMSVSIADLSYEYAGAEAHLRRLLTKGGMFKKDIMKAANAGGYSKKALELASKTLMIVKTQEGYGKKKKSFWRLPDQDD